MVVQHNLTAMNSNRMLGVTQSSQAKSTEKLSSGYKINRAADDAAGLSISEKMRKQIRGLTQASSNAQDGISAVQTAEGALTEVHDMLQRMNELAVKAANGTNSEDDRSYIQNEVDQLVTEIDRVSETTKFNETYLLKGDNSGATKDVPSAAMTAGLTGTLAAVGTDGLKSTFTIAEPTTFDGTVSSKVGDVTYHFVDDADSTANTASDIYLKAGAVDTYYTAVKGALTTANAAAATKADNDGSVNNATNVFTITHATTTLPKELSLDLHVGADSASTNKINLSIEAMSAKGLGVNGLEVNGPDGTKATAAIDTIKEAIQRVSTQRSSLGAVQNRLEHTINNLDNVVENTTSAEASIRDTDMATEMVKYSNNNILAQAGQSMLAQANQSNQGVLSLLQ